MSRRRSTNVDQVSPRVTIFVEQSKVPRQQLNNYVRLISEHIEQRRLAKLHSDEGTVVVRDAVATITALDMPA